MVCTECRDNDHESCEDTKHPNRLYRGCACQHAPRIDSTDHTNTDDHTD